MWSNINIEMKNKIAKISSADMMIWDSGGSSERCTWYV
jgi:hypothetical protein